MIAPGRIWWATLDKRRPVLIVSSHDMCDLDVDQVQVVPLSRRLRNAPTHVRLTAEATGLDQDMAAVVSEGLTIRRAELTDDIGACEQDTYLKIRKGLSAVLDVLGD
ncbi:MAG: type II toxin-antitoxin system PemK/MazF family toxin [Acidimicrobiales bacterium]